MLQIAAEVRDGRRLPILELPVLTPRLSSYWLALVTDVDVTTGRNLIDSMGTEVVVTDESIKEVVPGEPTSYAEAVRRALRSAAATTAEASPDPRQISALRSGASLRHPAEPLGSNLRGLVG